MAPNKITRERFDPKNRQEWRRWLKQNCSSSSGVWLVISKKNSGKARISLEEAVEEALCFGWIDSTLNKLDEKRFVLHFAPRKPKSVWSQSNKRRVEKLIREGTMTSQGLEKIKAARKDGSWNALDAIDQLTVPADLRKALAANADARKNFQAFSASSRKSILFWIQSARRPETRAKRIAETLLIAKKTKANHYRQ